MIKYLNKKFRKNLHLILPVSFFVFILSAIVLGDVLAASDIQTQFQVPFGEVQNGQVTNIAQYINAVYKYLVAAGGVLAGIMFAIGGFMYVTSAGDASKASQGKKYITNALLGLVLLVTSYVVLNTINPEVTELKLADLPKIEQDVVKQGDCPCDTDSDCGTGKFCLTNAVPFKAEYAAPDWVAGVNEVARIIGEYGDYAVLAATLGAGIWLAAAKTGAKQAATATAKSVAKKMVTKFTAAKTALTSAAKNITIKGVGKLAGNVALKAGKVLAYPVLHPVKFVGRLIALGVITGAAIFTAMALLKFDGFAFDLSSCPKTSGAGFCQSNLFKYNLIPHGLGQSDQAAFSVSVSSEGIFEISSPPAGRETFLYNKDGSLPSRKSMLGDTDELYFFSAPFASIEKPWLTFGNKNFTGRVNTDACDSSENHCPCIKWSTYDVENGVFECAQQARCVSGTDIFPNMTDNNIKFCLTGSQGEPCKDDNDCRSGLKCVVLTKGAGSQSLLFKGAIGILDQTGDMIGELKNQLAKITPTDRSVYALKSPYAYEQMCMPVVAGGATRVIDSECTITGGTGTYCEPGTGINNVPCKSVDVAKSSETLAYAGMNCSALKVLCYKEENGKPKYQVASFDSGKEVVAQSKVYTAAGDSDCFTRYGSESNLVNKIIQAIENYPTTGFVWASGVTAVNDFEGKKYENVLGDYVNNIQNPVEITEEAVKSLKKYLTVDNASLFKQDIVKANKKENYINQGNDQCYLKMDLGNSYSIFFEKNGLNYAPKLTNFYINLSYIFGEIGTWDFVKSTSNGKTLSDYTCGDAGYGQAIKEILWILYEN